MALTLTAMAIVPLATSFSLFSGPTNEPECTVGVPVVGVCLVLDEPIAEPSEDPSPSPTATAVPAPNSKPVPTTKPTQKPVTVPRKTSEPEPATPAKRVPETEPRLQKPEPHAQKATPSPAIVPAPAVTPKSPIWTAPRAAQALALNAPAKILSGAVAPAPIPAVSKPPAPAATAAASTKATTAPKATPRATETATVSADAQPPVEPEAERSSEQTAAVPSGADIDFPMIAAGSGVTLMGAALVWFALRRLPSMSQLGKGRRVPVLRGTH